MDNLVEPHGGSLVDLMAGEERAAELKEKSRDWPSLDLSPRQICDLELLLNGGFSPLTGFLNREDYESVCETSRLSGGALWPIPVTLDVSADLASEAKKSGMLALRDSEGVMLAALHVEDAWEPDRKAEATSVYGTEDGAHPAVRFLLEQSGTHYVGGRVEGLRSPVHYDFRTLRHSPRELRHEFDQLGWLRVVAFQTRRPMHRAEHELTLRAAKEAEANLLIHPVVGMTQAGDLDHYSRVHCYEAILGRYPQHTAKLSLLPLAMRMAGPREALWHAIVHKNYGCTHMIVGHDAAGLGPLSTGEPFYGAQEIQQILSRHEQELGVGMIPFRAMVYAENEDAFVPRDETDENTRVLEISASDLNKRLDEDREIPEWFTFPDVATQLQRRHPPRHRQGLTVFFSGLSGSGKSTIANVMLVKFLEMGGRPVTLLDGDIVRQNLSSELGFSKEDRDINIRRIGFVASEITKNGGVAICAPIAPYDRVRQNVRSLIEPLGGFVLVHVDTPLEVCEQRDRKGLYAKARAGIIKEFTGISDPYEIPTDADVRVKTVELTPEQSAQEVLLYLEHEGYVGLNGDT